MESPTIATADAPDAPVAGPHPDPSTAAAELIEDELLIEEISIDGMCGVY